MRVRICRDNVFVYTAATCEHSPAGHLSFSVFWTCKGNGVGGEGRRGRWGTPTMALHVRLELMETQIWFSSDGRQTLSPGRPTQQTMQGHLNYIKPFLRCLFLCIHRERPPTIPWCMLRSNEKQHRGGLAFQARRLFASLNSRPRVITKQKKKDIW